MATTNTSSKLNIIKFIMTKFGSQHSTSYAAVQEDKNNSGEQTPEATATAEAAPTITRKMAHELIVLGAVAINGEIIKDPQFAPLVDEDATLMEVEELRDNSCEEKKKQQEEKLLDKKNGDDATKDVVTIVQDALVRLQRSARVWVYDKPEGVDCNLTEKDPDSLLHVLRSAGFQAGKVKQQQQSSSSEDNNKQEAIHVFPVGRLDKESCGMLLLTNSGSLCERLLHPAFDHEKEYVVTLNHKVGTVPTCFYEIMRDGVRWVVHGTEFKSDPCPVVSLTANSNEVGNQSTLPPTTLPVASVFSKKKQRAADAQARNGEMFSITLKQGLNRQIRHMTEWAGRSTLEQQHKRKGAEQKEEDPEGDESLSQLKRKRDDEDEDGKEARISGNSGAAEHPEVQAATTAADVIGFATTPYRVARLQRVRIGPIKLWPGYSKAVDVEEELRITEVLGEDLEALLQWAFSAQK